MPRRGRRLTSPLIKKPGAPGGFVPIPYPNALDTAAERFAEIRRLHGDAAVGVIGRAAAPALAVEAEVVLLAGSPLGEMVELLVASGRIDVEVIGGRAAGPGDDPRLRQIAGARELVRLVEAGELRGLVSICFDPPREVPVGPALDRLEFHLAVDTVLGAVARRADIVLPLRAEVSLGAAASGPGAGELDEPVA